MSEDAGSDWDVASPQTDDERFRKALGDRLRAVRTRIARLGPGEFGASVGAGRSSVTRYESGRRLPDALYLHRVASVYGIPFPWLMDAQGPSPDARVSDAGDDDHGADVTLIPPCTDDPTDAPVPPLGLGRAWIRSQLKASPADLVIVAARGDAMEPTVSDGDLLLADTTRRGDGEDGIYALRRDGRVAVRRLQFSVDGGLVIRCDNQSYGDEHLEREDAARLDLIGRVVWAGRGL